MKRLIPKSLVNQAKEELRKNFISRILRNVNEQGCRQIDESRHY